MRRKNHTEEKSSLIEKGKTYGKEEDLWKGGRLVEKGEDKCCSNRFLKGEDLCKTFGNGNPSFQINICHL